MRTAAPTAEGAVDLLAAIGNTSLVPLRRVVPEGCCRISVKLEWENPAGSLKDRMAQAVIDEIEAVPTEEAKEMTQRLAREEGLFAGTSSGAHGIAALRGARRLGPGSTVVTPMADSGLKSLQTDVYRRTEGGAAPASALVGQEDACGGAGRTR